MSDNLPALTSDVHFEVALDPEPEPPQPFGELVVPTPDDRLPVRPEWMRREQARFHLDRLSYSARCHLMRVPEYLFWTAVWTPIGALRLSGKLIAWWHVLEQHGLRSQAIVANDAREWMRLHKEARETRKARGITLAVVVAILAGACYAGVWFGYWWAEVLAGVVCVPFLAHAGHPVGKPILRPAMTTPRFRLINLDIVKRAYVAAGLGSYDKPDQDVSFPEIAVRDGEGSRVVVDLPYGKSLKDAVAKKDAIASGLDVTESQVFLHRDPTSTRRHVLWVADRDPLAVPVGRTPLTACRATDIWKPAPMGLDERGQLVGVPLIWNSVLVGALPRAGKTFSARALGLFAALDPYVQMDVFDAKGSPDWRKFALVADSCAFGLTPTRAGLPPEILLATLNRIRMDVEDRYHKLSRLQDEDPRACPEGKLTRAIARDPSYGMPVRVLILDEVQEYYDLGKLSDEIADLLAFLVKVAPGAGVIVVASTQRPSGIGGSGQVQQRFTATRDNFQIRFSLRTSDWRVSEMVLGAGALGEGLDSSKLLPQYKGVGILRGASDASPTVRCFLADGMDAERILTAARGLRERAGTLSGMALGETVQTPVVSILDDVLAVMGEHTGLHWEALAVLLARRFPERYLDATAESVSAQCRAPGVGVPSVDVRFPAGRLGSVRKGCRRSDVEAATRNTAGQRS